MIANQKDAIKKAYSYREYLEKFLHLKNDEVDLYKIPPFQLGSRLASEAIIEIKEAQKNKPQIE
jgi:hypothetical protein